MIIRKKLSELSDDDKDKINQLLLSSFTKSRLDTYDEVIYYIRNENIIGFVGIQLDSKKLTVNQLCVHANYKNNGIGSMLLKYIENNFQSTLILYIDKNKENTEELYKFYIQRGYEENKIDNQNNIEEYVMINYR